MILHLMPRAAWEALPPDQPYTPADFASAGFIHCTAGDDALLAVANRLYQAQPGDFVALSIDESRLKAEVRWEAPVEAAPAAPAAAPAKAPPEAVAEFGLPADTAEAAAAAPAALAPPAPAQAYPHIYGPLNRDAVAGVRLMLRDAAGHFSGFAPYPPEPPMPFKKAADELLQATDAFSEALSRYKDRIEARMDEIDKNIQSKL
jgi:uncharacterized protein (DUF952 family)